MSCCISVYDLHDQDRFDSFEVSDFCGREPLEPVCGYAHQERTLDLAAETKNSASNRELPQPTLDFDYSNKSLIKLTSVMVAYNCIGSLMPLLYESLEKVKDLQRVLRIS